MENRTTFKVTKIILKQLNKNHEGKIYIQVVAHGSNNPKRISTGIWTSPSHWSAKKGEILKSDIDFQNKNFALNAIYSEILTVANDHNNPDFTPTYEKYKQLVEILKPAEVRARQHTAVDYFEQFVAFKELELTNKVSLRVYNCLLVNLNNFEKSNPVISLNDLNTKEFYFNFRNFLAKKLNDNTIYKTMSILSGFLKFLADRDVLITKPNIHRIGIKKYSPKHIALTKAELQAIIGLKLPAEDQKIIDTWVFEILTGLRYHDLATLNEAEIFGDHFTKRNKKTKVQIRVHLNPVALSILKKYNNVLPVPPNCVYNIRIKQILKENNIMCDAGDMVVTTKVVNGVDKQEKKLRVDMCSSHTARRTFCTLALSAGNTLNSIMASTGHTQLSSLSKYIVRVEPKFKDFV
jgi:site-specific recombinase XerD